ncbi:MAG: discoidin domain-containing protein [Phycisphaerae bacterium]|nr:discoidin domain-containing protein [Phycisphaerae bacterium]
MLIKLMQVVLILALLCGVSLAVDYPDTVAPGKANAVKDGRDIILSNNILSLIIKRNEDTIEFGGFKDKVNGCKVDSGEFFEIEINDVGAIKASQMHANGPCIINKIKGDKKSINLAERFDGFEVKTELFWNKGKIKAEWSVVLRDQSNYVRQILKLSSDESAVVKTIVFNRLLTDQAKIIGNVNGSPIVDSTMFFAYEHPNSQSLVYDSSLGINYALERPVKASDVYQDYSPKRIVDGDYGVMHHWGAQNAPVWVMVDLESIRDISKVNLITYYDGKRYYGYKIETSRDGNQWDMFADASSNTTIADEKGYVHLSDSVKARFVKVTITKNSAGNFYGGHIVELEVFGKPETNHQGTEILCKLARNTKLNDELEQSAVLGVVPTGQLRRGFMYYIERERVQPYKPFLHYNSWYDIAYPDRDKMNAVECVDVINGFGKELVKDRGVVLDSFVFDDGWDDPKTLWLILKNNFPHGWNPLKSAADNYNSKLGVWLSPWGGYGQTKKDRLEYGKTQGFETGKGGFSLAGEKYFGRFRDSCLAFVNDYDVNFFKFDGTDASLLNETEALFKLTGELYDTGKVDFISLTVGTWASPYWLYHGDSVWRGGWDMGFSGKGSKRQQWLNYRDGDTYEKMVLKGPLYPLSSFMNQGIAHAKWGTAKLDSDLKDFTDEVRSFFGIGTNLQELYISHDLMTSEMWDVLAEGAKWSRANADVLVDTHWIGGDPRKGEVYGCAAWQNDRGIIMLRNPDDKAQKITIDIGKDFELPSGAKNKFRLKSPWLAHIDNDSTVVMAGKSHVFELEAFEVVVLAGDGW